MTNMVIYWFVFQRLFSVTRRRFWISWMQPHYLNLYKARLVCADVICAECVAKNITSDWDLWLCKSASCGQHHDWKHWTRIEQNTLVMQPLQKETHNTIQMETDSMCVCECVCPSAAWLSHWVIVTHEHTRRNDLLGADAQHTCWTGDLSFSVP